ncbi:TPA: hypothetical protein ACIWQ3_004518, partial [Salmonella enterica subsp. enterica serovar Typhi]
NVWFGTCIHFWRGNKKVFFIQKIEFSDGKIIIDNESVSWSLKNLVHKQNTHAISKFIEKRKRNFI